MFVLHRFPFRTPLTLLRFTSLGASVCVIAACDEATVDVPNSAELGTASATSSHIGLSQTNGSGVTVAPASMDSSVSEQPSSGASTSVPVSSRGANPGAVHTQATASHAPSAVHTQAPPSSAPNPSLSASNAANAPSATASGSAGNTGSIGNPDPNESDAGGTANGPCGPVAGTHGSNPLFTDIFTADPAALVHDCVFYITAGRDRGTTGFELSDWYVLSSTDLVHWSDNGGPVMSLDTFTWANANAWAGQMVEKNGKFYWYVPVNERGGGMAIGVAVGESPLGPFEDAIGAPLINDALEMAAFDYTDAGQTVYTIDPTVFVDDDDRAYLLYGGFWRVVIVPLGEDMISIDGELQENTPPDFFEAPYLTKREGTYYLAYAAGSNPATIDYVTAPSPTGPWQNHGRLLDELPSLEGQDAPTSHPAIAEFQGEWYLVYHLSNGPGGGTYRRQVAMEKLTFEPDGSLRKLTPTSGLTF